MVRMKCYVDHGAISPLPRVRIKLVIRARPDSIRKVVNTERYEVTIMSLRAVGVL
jgi:hypothetical protein